MTSIRAKKMTVRISSGQWNRLFVLALRRYSISEISRYLSCHYDKFDCSQEHRLVEEGLYYCYRPNALVKLVATCAVITADVSWRDFAAKTNNNPTGNIR